MPNPRTTRRPRAVAPLPCPALPECGSRLLDALANVLLDLEDAGAGQVEHGGRAPAPSERPAGGKAVTR